ncbi:DNA mismatch repair protein MLH3 isoform X3 [Gossypium hirsutum]|uniref:DNA mismatch repair protein MLH3 isoform X3 n=1 Tax=Gossypium hirsutum TaxID=3635 RepID=A0ABM2Z4B2_GOSHI|nr:DNA mismatch repair protein MLH3 isoform X3 [Gossypium hirsutum]
MRETNAVRLVMGSIKPLPDAVRSTVRSATILFDLTRVVEELIFNSLDAAATKVSVFLSVGSSYVKVVDDGSGISRDGLVLLGERYVTSKLNHLSDLDAAGSSFGFRGEALASISDVALVEIVTKAYGRPNGYRKVIKGSKCLYLGIDDDRKDMGTTVVVRDLFCNQPVRKKQMQSSPKKVLQSVKKCVFRIALVHPMVYFNLIDIESEDELLSVNPSSSPLPLLMSGLGIEDCACLQKLNASDGSLKLSGYISGPCDDFTSKAFQYVYINSRLVCKGPIHKLLNNLSTSFESLHPEKANNWTKNGKRSRSQVVPSYIINISCPPSFYDLTFEPSKTYVEFKDWKPVCTLIETAVQHLWRKNISYVDGLGQAETLKEDVNILNVAEDFFDGSSVDLEFATRKRTKKYQPSSSLDKLTIDNLFHMDREDTPFEECNGNTAQFKDQQNDMKFVHWTDYSFQSLGDSLSKGGSVVNQRSDWHLWSSDNNILAEDHFLENRFIASGRPNYHVNNNNISSKLGNESLKFESCVTNETVRSVFPFDSREVCNDMQFRKNISKPFMQSCSFQRNQPLDRELVESDVGVDSPIDSLKTKRKWVCSNDGFNMMEVDFSDQTFDHLSKTAWQDGPKLVGTDNIPMDCDVLRGASAKLFLSCGDVSVEENGLVSGSVMLAENFASSHQFLSLGLRSGTSNLFAQFSYKNAIEGSFRSEKRTNFGHFSDGEDKDNQFGFDLISRGSSQEKCIHDFPNTEQGIDYAESSREFSEHLQQDNLKHKFSPEQFNVVIEDGDWPCSDSSINEHKRKRDCFRYQDFGKNFSPKERSRRSQSAPPFYIRKRRFISLHHCLQTSEESTSNEVRGPYTFLETGDKKPPQHSSGLHNRCFEPNFGKNRSNMNNKPDKVHGPIVQKCDKIEQPYCREDPELVPVQGISVLSPEEILVFKLFPSYGNQDPLISGTKWRKTRNNKLYDADNEDTLLDIASGFLNLAAESLVPKSIIKKCLTEAKVLQQVDKKFIPIVAGGKLAIIDQHAADERIQLEELRRKVLSGEGKSVAYLDTEKELILPEMGYQLLHNFSEQIRHWGWICDFHTQDSRSFKKNLNLIQRKPAVVILLALADTDGSSTMPPSVSRILNSKACRGAIMFGDSLLPSECSLIVEELKQTSLCFQCAHGRPTTAPLVNLEALHGQIAKMQVRDDEGRELWHGLCRQGVSLERASLRLRAAADEKPS